MTEILKNEIKSLNLKIQKDFTRFQQIKEEITTKYYDEISRGRCEEYEPILNKEQISYINYPRQGYEYFPAMQNYKELRPKNYEEMQKFYNDMYKEHLIFKNRITRE